MLVLWKNIGFGSLLYEIVPGFVANFLTIHLLNLVFVQEDEEVLEEFEAVALEVNGKTRAELAKEI